MKRKAIISMLLVSMMYCIPIMLHAQPGPGADPDAAVPVDGGLSLLLAAGAGYVVKKVHDKRKRSTENK